MLLRLLEIPLIDIILILLAIRFVVPRLFGIKSRKKMPPENLKDKIFSPGNSAHTPVKYPKGRGEYIDYEEIK
jgi:biopolymer transport protein ExbD